MLNFTFASVLIIKERIKNDKRRKLLQTLGLIFALQYFRVIQIIM